MWLQCKIVRPFNPAATAHGPTSMLNCPVNEHFLQKQTCKFILYVFYLVNVTGNLCTEEEIFVILYMRL